MTEQDFTADQRAEYFDLVDEALAKHREYRELVAEAGDWLIWSIEHQPDTFGREKAEEFASAAITKRAEWLGVHEQGKATAYGAFLHAEAERRKAEQAVAR